MGGGSYLSNVVHQLKSGEKVRVADFRWLGILMPIFLPTIASLFQTITARYDSHGQTIHGHRTLVSEIKLSSFQLIS